jgi:hypothetical protein
MSYGTLLCDNNGVHYTNNDVQYVLRLKRSESLTNQQRAGAPLMRIPLGNYGRLTINEATTFGGKIRIFPLVVKIMIEQRHEMIK